MSPLIDTATRELLVANGLTPEQDHHPVLKLFNPAGPAIWLIYAMEADGNTLYGLCDLGFGEPELGQRGAYSGALFAQSGSCISCLAG